MNKPTNKKLSTALANRKAYILSQTSTDSMLQALADDYDLCADVILSNYEKHWHWAYIKAVDLAQTMHDAWRIFLLLYDYEEQDANTAFDKILDLCQDKTEVTEVMDWMINTFDVSLSLEMYYTKIFARGHDFDE